MNHRWGASLVLCGSGLLAACGGGAGSTTGVAATDASSGTAGSTAPAATTARFAKASRSVTEAGTARFELTEIIDRSNGATTVTGSGRVDAKAGSEELTLDLGDLAGTGDGSQPALGSIDVRIVGGFAYVKLPSGLPGMAGNGTEWLRTPADQASDAASNGSLAGSAVGGNDPTKLLAVLNGGNPEAVGQEDVRGVSTTHYRGTFDLQAATDTLPTDQQDALKGALGALDNSGPLPVDVWLDDQGLVRRLELDLSTTKIEGADGSVKMTIELFDYGSPVDITAPTDFVDTSSPGKGFGSH
jgi:LppX_LprAFG lipoprotein